MKLTNWKWRISSSIEKLLSSEIQKTGRITGSRLAPLVEDILQQRKIDNEAWFAKNPRRKSNWMFPSIKYGKHMTEPRNAVEVANEEAGVTISLHDLRRTFVGETIVPPRIPC